MWHDLLVAVALMMVIEGLLPFYSPRLMRRVLMLMAESDDRALRSAGLISMILGVLLLYWMH